MGEGLMSIVSEAYWEPLVDELNANLATQAATLERVRALRDSHAHQARGSVFSTALVEYLDAALGPAPAQAATDELPPHWVEFYRKTGTPLPGERAQVAIETERMLRVQLGRTELALQHSEARLAQVRTEFDWWQHTPNTQDINMAFCASIARVLGDTKSQGEPALSAATQFDPLALPPHWVKFYERTGTPLPGETPATVDPEPPPPDSGKLPP
jgi:hypothetical protein